MGFRVFLYCLSFLVFFWRGLGKSITEEVLVCLDVVLVVFGEVGYEGRVKLVWDGIMNKDLGVFKFCFVYYFVFFERVFKVVLYLL